jgi:hypothetical protein
LGLFSAPRRRERHLIKPLQAPQVTSDPDPAHGAIKREASPAVSFKESHQGKLERLHENRQHGCTQGQPQDLRTAQLADPVH